MNIHHKIFLLFLFLLPTQLGYHFWPQWSLVFGIRVDYLSPAIYLTDILLISTLFFWSREFSNKYKNLVFPLVIFLVLNILFSSSWQVSIFKGLKIFEVVLLSLYVSQNWKYLKTRIWLPFSLASFYTLILVFFQMYFQKTIGGIFYFLGERTFFTSTPGIALFDFFGKALMRPYATFSHPNSLAGFSLVVLFILFLSLQELRKKAKIITITAIIGSLVLIVLSVSQLVWIALLIVLCVYFFHGIIGRHAKQLFSVFLVFCLAFSIFLSLFSQNIADSFSFLESIEQRLNLNTVSKGLILRKPIFGVGLGNFVNVIKNYPDKNLFVSNTNVWLLQPVHNIFLLTFAETGIVGLGLFLLVLFKAANSGTKYLILLLPILLTGMGDHYWLTLQQNLLLFGIVFGIVFSSGTITAWKKMS